MGVRIARRRQLLVSMAAAYASGMAAYAVCYFGFFKSNDSLEMSFGEASTQWQISLGRWLQPFWWLIRGTINAPWLIGMIALALFGLVGWIVTDLLRVDDDLRVALTSALLVTCKCLVTAHAKYINWVDVYGLCALLASVSVWVSMRGRRWYVAALPLFAAVSIYQAYFQFWCALAIVASISLFLHDDDVKVKKVIELGKRFVVVACSSMALYWISTRIAFAVTGITASTTYNGISSIGEYDGFRQVVVLLAKTWIKPLLWGIKGFPPARLALYVVLMAWGLVELCLRLKGAPRQKKIVIALLVVFLPFGASFVNFLSKGVTHDLVTQSYSLMVILAMTLICEPCSARTPHPLRDSNPCEATDKSECEQPVQNAFAFSARRAVPVLAMAAVLFVSIRYSNQILTQEQMRFTATNMFMTRVLDRIEAEEGYEPGVTPVAFVGSPEDAMLCQRPGYPDGWFVSEADFAITYSTTYQWYFRDVLGYPINVVAISEPAAGEAEQMGAFPAKDSVRMVDGTLVVKLGEQA